jgi:hypothetical protein
MANRFGRQPRESNWAPGAEARILEAFSKVEGKIEAVECRTSLCRVQAVFASHEAETKTIGQLFGGPSFRPPAGSPTVQPLLLDFFRSFLSPARETLLDGTVRVLLYMSPEGTIDPLKEDEL